MVFAKLFRRSDPHDDSAVRLYGALVEKARDPVFTPRWLFPTRSTAAST